MHEQLHANNICKNMNTKQNLPIYAQRFFSDNDNGKGGCSDSINLFIIDKALYTNNNYT